MAAGTLVVYNALLCVSRVDTGPQVLLHDIRFARKVAEIQTAGSDSLNDMRVC